jgi:hypothetical protein
MRSIPRLSRERFATELRDVRLRAFNQFAERGREGAVALLS